MVPWESNFGIVIGNELNFKSRWENIYEKADQKLCPLKIIKIINLPKNNEFFHKLSFLTFNIDANTKEL